MLCFAGFLGAFAQAPEIELAALRRRWFIFADDAKDRSRSGVCRFRGGLFLCCWHGCSFLYSGEMGQDHLTLNALPLRSVAARLGLAVGPHALRPCDR